MTQDEDEDEGARVRRAVDQIADAWAVPGGVIAVSNAEGLLFEYAFGMADRERGIPTTVDHLFEIGSISKIFTAIVLLQLVERGKVSLDDSASDVLGDALPDALSGSGLTVERLLQHTAGLPSSIDAVPDPRAQVGSYAGGVADCEPGSFFHYSNVGFLTLGMMAATITGEPFPALVRHRVLEPLGMVDSIAAVIHSDYPKVARGYQPLRDDLPWTPGEHLVVAPWLEADGADGNIAATARDVARFGRLLLNAGEDGAVLSARSFAAMTTRLAPDGEDVLRLDGVTPPHSSRYGLGINVEQTDGRGMVLTHGGGMIGFASFLLADLDTGLSVAVLTNANGDSPIAEAIARTAAAILGGEHAHAEAPDLDPSLWRVSDDPDPDSADRPRSLSSHAFGEFIESVQAGQAATDPIRFAVEVSEDSGDLVRIQVRSEERAVPLRWTWYDGVVAPLPQLGPFALRFTGTDWIAGPRTFRRVSADRVGDALESPGSATDPRLAYCGHFRTYSPWFTNFRIILRDDALILVATGGVEAPSDEVELVPVAHGEYRMGADPRLPERLVFGPVINGRAEWADRDGCRYSRSFTD